MTALCAELIVNRLNYFNAKSLIQIYHIVLLWKIGACCKLNWTCSKNSWIWNNTKRTIKTERINQKLTFSLSHWYPLRLCSQDIWVVQAILDCTNHRLSRPHCFCSLLGSFSSGYSGSTSWMICERCRDLSYLLTELSPTTHACSIYGSTPPP